MGAHSGHVRPFGFFFGDEVSKSDPLYFQKTLFQVYQKRVVPLERKCVLRAPTRWRNLTAHPRTARAAALTGQVQSRHQELAKRRADDPVAKQKVELLGERNRTEEHVKAQQAEVDRHRDAIASEERRGVELGAAGEALKQREAVEVPRARHKISLFANISSIRWDYQGTDDATLKGYVLNGEQMEQFAVDTRAKNDFAAINQLWGLVGA